MRTLLIDTCGDVGSIAFAEDASIVGSLMLPPRSASAHLLPAVHSLLREASWEMHDITGIGVVSGPGSFTGVRVGLACAKGLCEALTIPLAAVSRLKVLAAAAGVTEGYAVLNAGRGELFILNAETESVESFDAFRQKAGSVRVVVAEEQLTPSLFGLHVELYQLSASDSLRLVLNKLHRAVDDLASIEANYVRGEQQIYNKVPKV